MSEKITGNRKNSCNDSRLFTVSQLMENAVLYFGHIKKRFTITALCFGVLCTSCGRPPEATSASYKTSEDAIKAYRKVCNKLCDIETASTEELCGEVRAWMAIDTAVTRCVYDPRKKELCTYCIKDYENTRDSIKLQFSRLVLSDKRTYKDVVLLMEAASPYAGDSLLAEAMETAKPFFDSLQQDTKANIQDFQKELTEYRNFLKIRLAKGIHDKKDMLSFIKGEHECFAKYLTYMDSLKEENTNDIVYNTERCCRMVLQAVREGNIDGLDALVYMTVRDNKRLLENALACVDNILDGKITTVKEAREHASMVLRPYISSSPVSMALLYPADRVYFLNIAEETYRAVSSLSKFTGWSDGTISQLPYVLMNMTIANTK